MNKRCKSCKYRSTTPKLNICDYVILAEHSRGCPVENCTKYQPIYEEKSKGNRPFKYGISRVKELYDQGCNDHEIGRRLGIPPTTIKRYRQRLGLPPIIIGRPIKKKGAEQ